MSAGERDTGLVLRLSDFSESSQVAVVLLREHGLARLLGKGMRRGTRQRIAVGLDLLELGECGYRRPRGEEGLGTLLDWRQITLFPRLRESLPRMLVSLYAAEVTPAVLAEFDPHPEVFDALSGLLQGLEAASNAPIDALAQRIAGYQTRLLRAIGYAPNLRVCQQCSRPRTVRGPHFFNSTAGGLICSACAGNLPGLRRLPPVLFDEARRPAAAREWFVLLDDHISCLTGRRARGRAMLEKLLRSTSST